MLAASARPSSPSPPQIYRQFFTRAECRLLDSSPVETALSEINLLRILLMRLLAARARQHLPRAQAKGQVAIAHSWASGHPARIDHSGSKRNRSRHPKGERSNHAGAALALKRQLSMLAAFSEAGMILSSLVRFNVTYRSLDDFDDGLLQMFAEMDPYDL